MSIQEFYGNASSGLDRIPPGTPGEDLIPDEAWRSDCNYALSPYWDGVVYCEVPEGCDFSV